MVNKFKYLTFFVFGVVVGSMVVSAGAASFTNWRVIVRDYLSVGDTGARDAKLMVKSSKTDEASIQVQTVASQSEPAFRIIDSSGTVVFAINDGGSFSGTSAINGTTVTASGAGSFDSISVTNAGSFGSASVTGAGSFGSMSSTGTIDTAGKFEGLYIGLDGQTEDPCPTIGVDTMFYNSTSHYFCYCDGSTDDLKMNDNSTACF